MTTPIESLFNAPPPKRYKAVESSSLYLTMRDGVQIAIDVMLPAERPSQARLPTLMIMARYWRSMALRVPDPPKRALQGPRESVAADLIPRGFAVVVVDARGTGASMGVNRHPWMPEELADYREVADWITQQTWSDGNIGAFGISYEGATALRLASTGAPSVKAVIPQEIEYDVYTDVALPGGVFNEAFIKAWNASNQRLDNNQTSDLFPRLARFLIKGVRPVDSDRKTRALLKQAIQTHQANTDVYQAMRGVTYRDDPFGQTGVTLDDFSVFANQSAIEQSGVSVFSWGSWLDGAAAEAALRTFNTFSNPQLVVIGAWKHEMTASASPYHKPNAAPNPTQAQQWDAMAQFFTQTLQQGQSLTGKTLYYTTLGTDTWRTTDQFPPANVTPQTWYFQPARGLAPTAPPTSGSDSYTVDFEATTGLQNRWHTQMARPVVYQDRAAQDARLLTYTSAPLTADLEITGYPIVTLYVASSEADGAFFVYLEDVDENGVVRYITEGQLRAIHRKLSATPAPYQTGMPPHSFKRADSAPMPRGETVALTIGLQPTSVLIRKGHAVRVAIAGADKDTFARIPTQGTPIWEVSHGDALASHIQLPIVR